MAKLISAAWEAGFRAFDMPKLYCNEDDLGRALSAIDMPRGEVFVTTKVIKRNLTPPLWDLGL